MQLCSANQQPLMKDESSPNGGNSKQTKQWPRHCQRMRQLEERAHSSKDAVVKLDCEKVLDQRHKNSL